MCSTGCANSTSCWPPWRIVTSYLRVRRPFTMYGPDGPVPPITRAFIVRKRSALVVVPRELHHQGLEPVAAGLHLEGVLGGLDENHRSGGQSLAVYFHSAVRHEHVVAAAEIGLRSRGRPPTAEPEQVGR